MEQWLVYKHTSMESGKSYIGMTKFTMEKRWKEHYKLATTSNTHFHRAINLYGSINWEHAVLVDSISTVEEAHALERFYIKKYDTFENGYNSTLGGEGSPGIDPLYKIRGTEEFVQHKKRLSDAHKALHGTEEYTFYNPELGVKETLAAVDLANKYGLHQGYVRYVAQNKSKHCNGWFLWKGEEEEYLKDPVYTFEHCEYGKEHLTLKDMAKKYNLSRGNLSMVTSGQRRHTKGWTVEGMSTENTKVLPANNAISVSKVTADGDVVAVYTSIETAASENGCGYTVIRDRCTSKVKSLHNGYTYKFNK